MKTKVLFFLAGAVVTTFILVTLNQRHRYNEAVRALRIVSQVIPGKTSTDEVREAFKDDFVISGNCPSGTCTFSRSFDNMWIERSIFRKSLSFEVDITLSGGVVTDTSASLKVSVPDLWVGAAVLRSRYTACDDPGSSCTSVMVGEDPRTPTRIVSRLPSDPSGEIKQPAYGFHLDCLLPFRRCATIDDIYPNWKQLPNLPPLAAARG